ncbi:MAG: DUF4846 domain-containing protein [Sorangiineae bacterium]|nr:DUF4846 domain-containing protein [Polyangiaceae bacterium]MEB2321221.1 DUF4846 domain-containing protein [Sorangiineae bacterium]
MLLRWALPLALAVLACGRASAEGAPAPRSSAAPPPNATASAGFRAAPTPSSHPAPARASAAAPRALERSTYPWLDDASLEHPEPTETLEARFAPPPGGKRVHVESGSFAAWLRGLPLAAEGTPVRTYDGSVLHEASDPRIAAVVALDTGSADLQQCADAVMRLDAEWRWSKGARDMSYRAASGALLPFARWARGERLVARGRDVVWQPRAAPKSDHAALRSYLDAVFAWANTVSLERTAKPVAAKELRPGDFFIMGGNPGHAVMVLDVAELPDGRRVALLGQSYMPAQSYQVLRSRATGAWFVLDPDRDVATPFWRPFPWSSLRRLE